MSKLRQLSDRFSPKQSQRPFTPTPAAEKSGAKRDKPASQALGSI
ncbi:hypothetical protein [Ruminococcus sp. Marseille-P6503]|nr:hypothetical protein [Ruminococcus sp. Marseille-P6503]